MRGLVGRAGDGRAALGRRAAAAAIAAALCVAPAMSARAADGGFFGFLSAALGGSAPAPAPSPPAASEGEQVRPLTVRRAPARRAAHPGGGRARMARVPAKVGPVSIYEDPTLRHGDAVMTKDGVRVFAGGRFSPEHPYGDADFVAVSASKAVAPGLKKTAIELSKLPHG